VKTFTYTGSPARVVFGPGAVSGVADEVRRLGGTRVLLLSGPAVGGAALAVRGALGPLLTAEFGGAAMHTPVEVTEEAQRVLDEHAADCLVAVGGGSATGLAKALAVRTGLPQLVLPTTYAGSEMTALLGETSSGVKVTRTSPSILPSTVIYDVDFTLSLPVGLSVCSAVNALAHAVEALYSAQANPVTDGMALEAIGRIACALPRIAAEPDNLGLRTDLLQAAWLAGMCLGTVGMGLHHKLCHALGGTLGLPHAQTHAVILPQVMAYNAGAVPEIMERIVTALGTSFGRAGAPAGVFDLVSRAGGPTSLRELGMLQNDIAPVARRAAATPYPNPREVTADSAEELLRRAWRGVRPSGGRQVPDLTWLTGQVVASLAGTPDDRTRQLVTGLVRRLHSFVTEHELTQAEWQAGIGFLTRTGQTCAANRQEFVLLSDVLGVSSAVDALASSRTPEATPSAVLGPFYLADPPIMASGADVATGLPGTPLWADIRVEDEAGKPVPGASVDVWQSNQDGFYDVQLPDLDGPVLRARFTTDGQGCLAFWSIVPAEYPIPADGPVGQLLAATGRHPWRAPHLHFMITPPGGRPFITQLFVAGGRYLDSDAVFGVKQDLVVDFTRQRGPAPAGRAVDGEWCQLRFTFRIEKG